MMIVDGGSVAEGVASSLRGRGRLALHVCVETWQRGGPQHLTPRLHAPYGVKYACGRGWARLCRATPARADSAAASGGASP